MSNNGQNSGSKKQTYIIIALAVVVVIALGVIVFLVMGKDDNSVKDELNGGRGTVVTKDNVDDVLAEDTEDTSDDYYTTSMSINWHFDGKVSQDAYVANVTENTRTVYFDLYLADTSEMIYSSPYIPVGAEMQGVTLDKELEPGSYETILVYHLVDEEENELSTLSIALTIYVN